MQERNKLSNLYSTGMEALFGLSCFEVGRISIHTIVKHSYYVLYNEPNIPLTSRPSRRLLLPTKYSQYWLNIHKSNTRSCIAFEQYFSSFEVSLSFRNRRRSSWCWCGMVILSITATVEKVHCFRFSIRLKYINNRILRKLRVFEPPLHWRNFGVAIHLLSTQIAMFCCLLLTRNA